MQSPVEDIDVDDDAPGAARPASRQMVRADGDEMTLADYYHDKSKHSRASVMAKAGGLDWSSPPGVESSSDSAPAFSAGLSSPVGSLPAGGAASGFDSAHAEFEFDDSGLPEALRAGPGLLYFLPHRDGLDGGFVARWRRRGGG